MRTRSGLLLLALAAACGRSDAPLPECAAFADHLDALAAAAIRAMPADEQAAAQRRYDERRPKAHARALGQCTGLGSDLGRNATYRCMMAAATAAELKACPTDSSAAQ